MSFSIKKLFGTLVAMLAIAAVSAPSALAAEFHSEVTHTFIKGSQVGEDKYTFRAGTTSCAEAAYAGTAASGTSTPTEVSPYWTECRAFGFINSTWDTNECKYVFQPSKTMDIACSGGKGIVITSFNCYITILPQTGLSGLTYTNTGTGNVRDLDIAFSISGIEYTQESKNFPGCLNGTRTDGNFTGAATVRGFDTEGKQVGIWFE